jgi:hypothetical protein
VELSPDKHESERISIRSSTTFVKISKHTSRESLNDTIGNSDPIELKPFPQENALIEYEEEESECNCSNEEEEH